MIPRFITKSIHAYLDYPVAFGLGEGNLLAFWLSVVTGAAAFLLTILMTVDGMVGAAFVIAPVVLGFTGLEFWYYMVLGLTVLLVVGLHKAEGDVAAA